jgi:hypothetical protein
VLGYNYPGSEWYQDSYTLVTTGSLPDDQRPGVTRRVLRSLNPF